MRAPKRIVALGTTFAQQCKAHTKHKQNVLELNFSSLGVECQGRRKARQIDIQGLAWRALFGTTFATRARPFYLYMARASGCTPCPVRSAHAQKRKFAP